MRLCTVEDREDSLLLRKVSRPLPESAFFSEEYGLLVGCMLATVRNPENEGVGIAAPQVGILRRIVSNRNSRGCCILSAPLYTKSRQKECALL